jgi:recombination protein RecA
MTMIALNHNGSPPVTELGQTLTRLQKRFGATAIGRLPVTPATAIPTGFPALDTALGIGGLPRGRIVDVFGPEGSGKTTLCLQVIGQAQQQGGIALFVDVEHGLDLGWAQQYGVDTDRLYVAQPDSAEIALEIVEAMVRAGTGVIVIDSATALTPRAEIEADMGDSHPGLMAGLMSRALRKLVGPLSRNQTLLITTNQLRQRATMLLSEAQTATGGMALRHYASVRLELRPQQLIKRAGVVVGRRIRATVVKNKVAPPHRAATLDILHDRGTR